MRDVLQSLGIPHHPGLAYSAWAPVGDDGTVPVGRRREWLSSLAALAAPADYRLSFQRWKASFSASRDRVFDLELASRLLVGHGNSSATGIGITVHHTWGVPVIPGSALKGLVAHYVDAVYGPDNPGPPPWEQSPEDRARADYQGLAWRDGRIERGPGVVYRALFGAPDAKSDVLMRAHGFEAGASAGAVIFHDAVYVPGSSPGDKPFATDVLTVHQKRYYDPGGTTGPNDYDDPNPVVFFTVRPRVRLLFALSGPADWTELAEQLLRDALSLWGVGGKTSAGYGRLAEPENRTAAATLGRPESAHADAGGARLKPGDRVEAILLEERTKKSGWKARHEASGLTGPIQNTGDVPATEKAGNHVMLVIASVGAREIAFRFPTGAPEPRKKGTQ